MWDFDDDNAWCEKRCVFKSHTHLATWYVKSAFHKSLFEVVRIFEKVLKKVSNSCLVFPFVIFTSIFTRWSRNGRLGGGEAEMGSWGAIGDPVNSYIYVVLLTLSDQMS